MTPEQLAYWLQGFFELQEAAGKAPEVTPEQAKMIRDHVQSVFHKVTPMPQTVPFAPSETVPQWPAPLWDITCGTGLVC